MIQQKRYFVIEPTRDFVQLINKTINVIEHLLETADTHAYFHLEPVDRTNFDRLQTANKPVMSHKGVELPTNKEITRAYCSYLHSQFPDIYEDPHLVKTDK